MYILPGRLSLFILLAVISVSLPCQVLAQASECGTKRKVSAGALDEPTWKRLNEVYEDVGEENYDLAFDKIQKLLPRAKDNYEKAVMSQALAQVEWARKL